MAVQIYATVSGRNGVDVRISIYNSSFIGTAYEVLHTSEMAIKYDSQDDPLLEPLKTSEMEWVFMNEAAQVDTLIANLVAGTEDQFHAVVTDETSGDLIWAGVVLMDMVQVGDTPKPRPVTIRAIDGIGRLKELEFEEVRDSGYADVQTMAQFIITALSYNGLETYWSGTDAYIRESIEFYDTQLTTPTSSDSPLTLTRCDKRLFADGLTEVQKQIKLLPGKSYNLIYKDYQGMTCFEVIRSILQLYCARMVHYNGCYYIQQVRNFDNATYAERVIFKAGTYSTVSTISHRQVDGTDVDRKAGGLFTYLPPLQRVSIINSPATVGKGAKGNAVTMRQSNQTGSYSIDLGNVKRVNSNVRLDLQIPFQVHNAVHNQLDWQVLLTINVKCGSYRLKSSANDFATEWTTTLTDRVERRVSLSDLSFHESQFNPPGYYTVRVRSNLLPWAIGTTETGCEIDVEFKMSKFTNPAQAATADVIVDFEPPTTSGGYSGESTEDTELYEVVNPSTQNSMVIDYEELVLTDNPNVVLLYNTFEVWNGTAWVAANVWNAGYSTNYTLNRTVALETMALQRDVVEIISTKVFVPAVTGYTADNPDPTKSYYYDSKTWVFNGGKLDFITNEIDGQWFSLNIDTSTITSDLNGDAVIDEDFERDGIGDLDRDKFKDTIKMGKMSEVTQDETTAGGAITSLAVSSLLNNHVRDGDTIHIVDPINWQSIDTFTVNGDVASGATSIIVDSKTPSADIYSGYWVMHDLHEVMAADKVRADFLRTVGTGTPTTSSPIGGNGSIQVGQLDDRLYYESNGKVFYLAGTESI